LDSAKGVAMSKGANHRKTRKRPHWNGRRRWLCCDLCHKGWGVQNPERPLPQVLKAMIDEREQIEALSGRVDSRATLHGWNP